MNMYLKERKLLFSILVIAVVRLTLFAFANSSIDYVRWVTMGQRLFYGQHAFYGVYQGPVYIFSAAYALWVALTHSPTLPLWTLDPQNLAFTLFMKIPFIILDFATVLLIIHMVRKNTNSHKRALWAGILWLTSPLIFLCENHSPAEIVPALLILLGAYAIYRSRAMEGSLSLAVGSAVRLAPLLITWIYVAAFARLRQFKNLIGFLGVQLALFVFGILYIRLRFGAPALQDLLGSYPGVFIPEVLRSYSAIAEPRAGYNPVQLSLGVVIFLLIGYFVTRANVWNRRVPGAEALAVLAAYFALVFQDAFILWMVPLLFVYAFTTKYGPVRLLLITILGFLYIAISDTILYTANGAAVLLIPNMNPAMSALSSTLLLIGGSTSPLTWFFRSLFSASLVPIIFWIMRDESINSHSSEKGFPVSPRAS